MEDNEGFSSKVSGVYILNNVTKGMYYIGQAKSIFDRVNQHFTGKGNGDVYADYKYGSVFTITLVLCE
jgi:excinuclease UvrABC nuclease subunit